ncbi:exodeoxyribonuclease VII small subunit [Nanchangia anserum]|uniref:Exodeoxyribonuclease 7 small subunit n=1 Tax=Nanchangia anserum TaxID=2692125 RepID=A0A8I0GDG1_9ACTO|nr:exodeoxyribonuclease VII small subunit [Nanchangia anserum]MBD3689966.1 exodeoxyribonuclease VII small subunit [Nanchangia anserum]QOX82228.1 exodeoxyribonuclease VII small subunit [Nanchangia anserum]
MPADTPRPVAELSYEEARAELVNTVRTLETGQAPLEASMEMWERGEELAQHCQAILDAAQARIDRARGTEADTED